MAIYRYPPVMVTTASRFHLVIISTFSTASNRSGFNNNTQMKKVVLKVELHDDRIKQKVMRTTSGISGVESVNVDIKDKKLTIIGEIDPVKIVGKLRKLCHTEIMSVGEAKESEKKEEKNENIAKAIVPAPISYSHVYYPPPPYYVGNVQEYPNSGCVIC